MSASSSARLHSASKAPGALAVCGKCENSKPSPLAGYGYCKSAPTLLTRARFVPDTQECWIPEQIRPRQRG